MIIAFIVTLLLIWLFIIINNTYGVIPTKTVLIFNYSISILINLIACTTNYFGHLWILFGVNAACIILASIAIVKLVKEWRVGFNINLLFYWKEIKSMSMDINATISFFVICLLIYAIINSYKSTPTKTSLIISYSICILGNLIMGIIHYLENDLTFFFINIGCIILLLTTVVDLLKK